MNLLPAHKPFCRILFVVVLICFSTTAYSQLLPDNATVPDISNLKDEVANKNKSNIKIPNIAEEKKSISQLRTEVKGWINFLSTSDNPFDLDIYKNEVTVLIDKMSNLQCSNLGQCEEELENIEEAYSDISYKLSSRSFVYNNGEAPAELERINEKFGKLARYSSTYGQAKATLTKEKCESLTALFKNPETKNDLTKFLEIQKAAVAKAADEKKQKLDAFNSLKSELDIYSKKLDEMSQTTDTKMSLQTNLYLMILVIGLLSIATIGIVRWFPLDVMKEWVESGQVIQFVTVMILLSVIMCLGLAGLLSENTLGTLLGGIGGYVLSQGIGRSAARDAVKQINAGSNPQNPVTPVAPQDTVTPQNPVPPQDTAPPQNPPVPPTEEVPKPE